MLKRKTRIFFLFFFSINVAFAQEQSKLEVGIHGAPAAAIFYGVPDFKKDFDVKYQPSFVFSAGISVQYNLRQKWSAAGANL